MEQGDRKSFWDDCGAWTYGAGPKSYHLPDGMFQIYKTSDNLYGKRKIIDGETTVEPFAEQPDQVLVLHRYYAKLKREQFYQRRISHIEGFNVFVVEYLGIFPDHVEPHGNAKKSTTEYVRTHPHVINKIAEKCRNSKAKPRKIYQELQEEADDDLFRPRNKRQVENIAYNQSDRQRTGLNLADEMQGLMSRQSEESENFVQGIFSLLHKQPIIVLFTERQISDIKIFCKQSAPNHLRSVLSVDRTFNLSSLFVTMIVYRNRKVVRRETQEAPIFIGPIMLHGDGQLATYSLFFSLLQSSLQGSVIDTTELKTDASVLADESILTGSDEEAALIKAMKTMMPQSKHLFCMIHCKDNVRHHMTSEGVEVTIREGVISLLFGREGLAESSDEVQFDNRKASVLQYIYQNEITVLDYIQKKIFPKILNNCEIRWREAWLDKSQWTNNNCESANHILKMQVDWKVSRVTELIGHLHSLVTQQYTDLRRALCGLGEYELAPAYRHRLIPQMRWHMMSEDVKQQHFLDFCNDTGMRKNKRTITSSDQQLTITGSPKVARKKSQRRRPNAERTFTAK